MNIRFGIVYTLNSYILRLKRYLIKLCFFLQGIT